MDNYSTIYFPVENINLEYRLLEWYLIINRKLYENHIIDIITFNDMKNYLLIKLDKLKSRCI